MPEGSDDIGEGCGDGGHAGCQCQQGLCKTWEGRIAAEGSCPTFGELLGGTGARGLLLLEVPAQAVVPQRLGAAQALQHSVHEALPRECWGCGDALWGGPTKPWCVLHCPSCP